MVASSKCVIILFLFCSLLACDKKVGHLKPIELIQWVENESNGLQIKKELGQLEIRAQYKPNHYIIAKEARKVELASTYVKEQEQELGNQTVYCDLRLINNNGQGSPLTSGGQMNYSNRLEYLTFGMQRDLKLVEGQDTLNCALYQFVRNNELAPYVDVVLGFERKKEGVIEDDLLLVLEDNVFGVGTIKLQFDEQNLKNLPQLKTIE